MLKYFKKYLGPKEAVVSVYKRGSVIFLHPNNKSAVGGWIAAEPCTEVPINSDNQNLGALIRSHLKKSKRNVAHPKNFKGGFDFVLKKAGVKSYKQFMSGCKHCSVHQIGKTINFVHSIKDGTRGFSYTGNCSIQIDVNSTDEKTGESVHECLDKSL